MLASRARGIAWTLLFFCCSSAPEGQTPAADTADAAPYEGCKTSGFPLSASGVGGRVRARVLEGNPDPPAKYHNRWTLEVTDAGGALLEDVEIAAAETFMPVHDHAGVPPPTSEAIGGGAFQLGIDFMMRGPWEVRLQLASKRAGSDRVVFDVCVAE